jgi:predicted restriction endonuclease
MDTTAPNTPVLESFEQWKQFLSQRVNEAKSAGASEQTIANAAAGIGSFLAQKVDPRNREQRLLKELWDCGTQDERNALASVITKMVSDGKVH